MWLPGEKAPPHGAPVPKKSWGKQLTPRHCLPSEGEGGFSYHTGAFPSCPPVFIQEGGAAPEGLNGLFG